jgi:hypothetical protein
MRVGNMRPSRGTPLSGFHGLFCWLAIGVSGAVAPDSRSWVSHTIAAVPVCDRGISTNDGFVGMPLLLTRRRAAETDL